MSENYFQHADHFTRILNDQENFKRSKFSNETLDTNKNEKEINLDLKIKKEENTDKAQINKKDEAEAKTTVTE